MLTPQQKRVLEFIRGYSLRHSMSPTLQEIADALDIRHRGSVSKHLSTLVEKGYLKKSSAGWRGFQLKARRARDFSLPLAGSIAAGRPIEAIEGQDQLDLYDYLLGPGRFLLKVKGDSMIEAGILDGDLVVIQQQEHADNGDIVVALIDEQEATLKYMQHRAGGKIQLRPANPALSPMLYTAGRVRIQGVLVAQLRKYA